MLEHCTIDTENENIFFFITLFQVTNKSKYLNERGKYTKLLL